MDTLEPILPYNIIEKEKGGIGMERLRSQYRYYSRAKDKGLAFQKDFPQLAQQLRQKQRVSDKNQVNTFTHWLLLLGFGMLTIASFPQQLVILLILVGITALVKGPGMLLFGMLYSFLVSLFPPLGIFLSALFFLLSLYQLTRNWRFGLAAAFFYLYPMMTVAFRQFAYFDQTGWLLAFGTVGLVGMHFLFRNVYVSQPSSKALAWSLISLPYDCLVFLLPSKKGKKIRFKRRK